jgi:hypothetical protein
MKKNDWQLLLAVNVFNYAQKQLIEERKNQFLLQIRHQSWPSWNYRDWRLQQALRYPVLPYGFTKPGIKQKARLPPGFLFYTAVLLKKLSH